MEETITATATFEEVTSFVAGLCDDELTERLRSLETDRRRVEAETAVVVAEAKRRALHQEERHRTIGSWLRSHTNWSRFDTNRRVRGATLAATVPGAGEALHSGRIGVAQFNELARARANPRCGEQLADDAEMLLEHCEQLSFEASRQCIIRWESLADADGTHRDRDASVEGRRAFVGTDGVGVVISASGGTPLQAEEMRSIFDRYVEAEFERDRAERDRLHGPDAPSDLLPRTDAQRRFDAMLAMLRSAANAEGSPVAAAPVLLNILVDEFTHRHDLASHGLAIAPDEGERPDIGLRRRETADGSPLTPDDIVLASLDGHIRRVVLDSAGVVIDWGRKRRLYTGPAREAAMFSATGCTRPGCLVHGRFSQVDHLRGWEEGGETDQDNAGPACQHDNRAKHALGITVRRTPDGYLNWHRRDGTFIGPVGRRRLPDEREIDDLARKRVAALRPTG